MVSLYSFPAQADITGPALVVDGDTIWIGKTKIRIWAIDAPEVKQECHRKGVPWKCGVAATEHLRKFIEISPSPVKTVARAVTG